MKQPKLQATKAIGLLRRTIEAYDIPAWKDRHRRWLGLELSKLMADYQLRYIPASKSSLGGEGVSSPVLPQDQDQSSPTRKNLQCAPREGLLPGQNAPATAIQPIYSTTVYPDGREEVARVDLEGKEPHVLAEVGMGVVEEAKALGEAGKALSQPSAETTSDSTGTLPAADLPSLDKGIEQICAARDVAMDTILLEVAKEMESNPVQMHVVYHDKEQPAEVGQNQWPQTTKVKVTGFCNNPKLCLGKIVNEDGRLGANVTVWKGVRAYRTDIILPCKLDEVRGLDARYIPV